MTGGATGLVRVLTWRRIAGRPVRSGLTATGVAVGVAFLFSITSLNAQLTSNARETAAVLSGPRLLQVTPASPSALPDGLAEQLATDSRVAAATPLLLARSTASHDKREAGVFVLGVTPEAVALAPGTTDWTELEISESVTEQGIVISGPLARRLHAEPDSKIALHASTGVTALPVVAVASSPLLNRINAGMAAIMPLAEAQRLFGRTGSVDQILLLANPGTDMASLRRDIGDAIDGIGVVGSPGEAAGGAGGANFALMRLFTNFIGAFVVLAALMLVFHTMSTATAERRTEIALARSLGSSRRQLLVVTLTEAGFLGVLGTAVGLVAGATLAHLVVPLTRYMYDLGSPVDLPTDIEIQIGPAVVAAVAGIVGSVVGAVIPARSAARAAPIDAFRPTTTYEWRDPTRPTRQLAIASAGAALLVAGAALAFRRPVDNPTEVMTVIPVMTVYLGALIVVPTTIPFVARAAATLLGRVSSTSGRLAADALRANPRRTTINVMALLVPVAAVVLTGVGFGSGLTAISRLSRAVVGAPINVDADSYVSVLGGSVASQPLAPEHQSVLAAVVGVRTVLPYQNANVSLADGSAGIVYAVPLTAAERAGVADMVETPRLADDPAAFSQRLAAGEIAASRFAARQLDLELGSSVTLPTPSGPRAFTVGALFDDWAWQPTFAVDLDTYRTTWDDMAAYRYAIVPTTETALDDLRRRLDAAVAGAAMPAQVHTREQTVAELEANTTIFLPLMRGMTLGSLVFAALALGNAAFTAVTEQRWTLALQRALGMSRRHVARSLALEAMVIGFVGAIGGAVVGLGLGVFGVRLLSFQVALSLDYAVPWGLAATSTVLGVVVAVTATYYPRRIAGRVPIIEALRFE